MIKKKKLGVFDFNQKTKSFILIPSLTEVLIRNGGRMKGKDLGIGKVTI